MHRNPHSIGIRLAGAGLAFALGLGHAEAARLNVPAEYVTIQDAVDAATDGDVIIVADGNYDGVNIVGKSLTLRSASSDRDACIIDNGPTGVYVAGTGVECTIRGFTFSGVRRGFEITLEASARIEDCIVADCTIGGLFMNGTTLEMSDCVVRNNETSNSGAGMSLVAGDVKLARTLWLGNKVLTGGYAYGGAIGMGARANLVVTDSVFWRNVAAAGGDSQGGAIHATGGAPITIVNTRFADNEAEENGGAIYLENRVAYFGNVEFIDNTSGFGGGVFIENAGGITDDPVVIANALIVGNVATTGSGGGIRNRQDSRMIVTNVTVYDNMSTLGGGGIANGLGSEATIANSIFGDNVPGDIAGDGVTTVTYSNVEGGYAGVGNTTDTPGFVDAAGGDFRLTPDSPCIDAGSTPAYSGPPLDLDGNTRAVDDPDSANTGCGVADGAIDMGVYEYQPVDTCPSDIDGDGAVTFADVLEVLRLWGPCP